MTLPTASSRDSETSADEIGRSCSPWQSIAQGGGDLVEALVSWRLWSMLGWNDIRQRYRRSLLGPFWITISMAIFVVLLGSIYAKIFHLDTAVYLPFVAAGLIVWGFISGSILEASSSFTEGTGIIKQIKLPFSLFVLRTVWRALIILLHTVVLMLPMWVFFGTDVNRNMLLVAPGLILVALNQVWIGTVVAVLSTRFRDVIQLVATAIQISMFATPIMWPVSVLSESRYIAYINPFYHMIELVRMPLLGEAPAILSYGVVVGMIILGYVFAAYLLGSSRHRIVYWL